MSSSKAARAVDLSRATRPAHRRSTLRDGGAIQWSDAQRGWAVIGHAAVTGAFRETATLSADRIGALERVAAQRPEGFGAVVDLLRGWMIFRDPPAHTRLREPCARRLRDDVLLTWS